MRSTGPRQRALPPIESHERRSNDYTTDASFRSGPSWPHWEADAACSPLSNNTERYFSKRVARDAHDKDGTKEPSRVGYRDRFAHCDSRDADHRAVVHNGNNPAVQLRR